MCVRVRCALGRLLLRLWLLILVAFVVFDYMMISVMISERLLAADRYVISQLLC